MLVDFTSSPETEKKKVIGLKLTDEFLKDSKPSSLFFCGKKKIFSSSHLSPINIREKKEKENVSLEEKDRIIERLSKRIKELEAKILILESKRYSKERISLSAIPSQKQLTLPKSNSVKLLKLQVHKTIENDNFSKNNKRQLKTRNLSLKSLSQEHNQTQSTSHSKNRELSINTNTNTNYNKTINILPTFSNEKKIPKSPLLIPKLKKKINILPEKKQPLKRADEMKYSLENLKQRTSNLISSLIKFNSSKF